MTGEEAENDLLAGLETPDEEKYVTSVVDPHTFRQLEEWRAARDMSRSAAIRELIDHGIQDELWHEKVAAAQDHLKGSDKVAFFMAVITADGNGYTNAAAREGFDADLPIDAPDRASALLLALLLQIDAYADLSGTDVEEVLNGLMYIYNELGEEGLEDFDLEAGA